MNIRGILLPIYRTLRPVVDTFHLNRIARPIWAKLWKQGSDSLVHTVQNGRKWRLASEVALRGEWLEFTTIEWLRSVISPGMTVIDVGANVGLMTLEMAHLVGASGRVFAIEPGPGNFKLLKRHVEGNGLADRVVVLQAACCAQHGGSIKLDIYGHDTEAVGSGFQIAEADIKLNPLATALERHQVSVPAISIDGLCAEVGLTPTVIKIDVEGAEAEVFRGATGILQKHRPAVIFGFHPFAFKEPAVAQREIMELLKRAGLQVESGGEDVWTLAEYTAK